LRELPLEERADCRILSEPSQHWVDGGEERIAGILSQAQDLSSLSDELALQADDWITRYHLSRERGNVVRPLALTPDARVLEVGAGCGAVTRALGESAGLVDALEPTLARARCAALRTRDLPRVQVHVGMLEDVPREPVYDAVIAVGVLEYVGGATDDAVRVEFLREASARLRPGGCVVVAIENRLGVKYFAGAHEDHAGRPFEGLEEYPSRGPFKTFARDELARLIADAGLEAQFLHAFPDYKLPRLVFADALLDGPASSLAWRAARFPSYDATAPRPRLASELHLWRGLLQAGLGGQFANSFIVLCHPSGGRPPWPAEQQAVFYAANRRAPFVTESRVLERGGGLVVARSHLAGGDAVRREGALENTATTMAFEPGPTLLDRLEHADEADFANLLARWRRHVLETSRDAGERLNIDPMPDNIIDGADGWRIVDDEWACAGWEPDTVLARCLVYLASSIAERLPPDTWPEGCRTTGDLVRHLATCADAGELDAPLEQALQLEAELQAQVTRIRPGADRWDEVVAEELERLRSRLVQPLELAPLGRREWEIRTAQDSRVVELSEKVQEFHDLLVARNDKIESISADLRGREAAIALNDRELDDRQRRIVELEAELERVHAAHAVVVSSRSWRITSSLRRLATAVRRTS
jgi:SAM-dependent methyltransferase